MGQILRADKIGVLSEAGGTISLSSSILTIGGQQYQTSSLNVVADLSSANNRYQVYAISTAGVISIVTSQNENSVGPAGSDAWILVGSYWSDSTSSFDNFIEINSSVGISGRAQVNSTAQGVSSGIYVKRVYDGNSNPSLFGKLFNFDISNSRFYAPVAGIYKVNFNDYWINAAWTIGQSWQTQLVVNGIAVVFPGGAHWQDASSTTYWYLQGHGQVQLNQGDYVELFIYHNGVGGKNMSVDAGRSYIEVNLQEAVAPIEDL